MESMEEDLGAMKSAKAVQSAFCGSRYSWSSIGTVTYENLLFESNNIAGAIFDLDSGSYRAGAKGTYRVDLAIGYMQSTNGILDYNQIYIEHNGRDIQESQIYSHITTDHTSHESGGRSLILHLEEGDVVSVRVANVYYCYYTTFCVSYEGH